jgi:hypothetical protein
MSEVIVVGNAPAKFGFNQIGNPTPKWANWIFRIVLYGAAIVNITVIAFTDIPQPLQLLLLKYSGSAVIFVHMISKMFGIDLSDVQAKIDLVKGGNQ